MSAEAGRARHGTPAGRWVVLATVLGSGMAFLDGTVVNVALPAIRRDLDSGLSGLQWILDAGARACRRAAEHDAGLQRPRPAAMMGS